MTKIVAGNMHFKELDARIRNAADTEIIVENCIGQRYIASGLSGKNITINGIPGNALGAYFGGGTIITSGNAQDATGDTMNDGTIIIHGSCGDGAGYGMRGGKIFIRDHVGYRAGIHMKAYRDKLPVMVIGGCAGSFLGEYQAGGVIIALGLRGEGKPLVGNFCGTGMHGGKIVLRCEKAPSDLPGQIVVNEASAGDLAGIEGYIGEFCRHFKEDEAKIMNGHFFVLTPNSKNPYKQLYTYH